MAQDGHNMAPKGPKKAQDRPKMGPRWPKMGPRWDQEGSREGPKSVAQGFRTSKAKNGVPGSISNADLGRFGGPLGTHVGPMLGPVRAH